MVFCCGIANMSTKIVDQQNFKNDLNFNIFEEMRVYLVDIKVNLWIRKKS
jgi:hypothetical protein